MEFELSCDVCCTEFSENVLPKVLSCGHTVCLPCLDTLIRSNPKCPNCRKQFNMVSTDCYPTNYLILRASNFFKRLESSPTLSKNVMKRIDVLKEKLTVMQSQTLYNIHQTNDQLSQLNNHLSQLQGLTNSENEITDMNEAKQVVKALERQFEILELRSSVDIHLTDYNDSNTFLFSLYNRLKDEEKIYAVKRFDDIVKYGKLTVENNGIFFYTFSETMKPDNASIINFDYLKKCQEFNDVIFLKLCCNENGNICTAIIRMFNPKLAYRFIQFCTGENGISYKGCYYQNFSERKSQYTSVLELKNYTNHNLNSNENHSVCPGDAYITDDGMGGFKIYKALISHRASCIGIVESPRNLYDYISFEKISKMKVGDCGVIFKLNQFE